jgi:hypothetical protein
MHNGDLPNTEPIAWENSEHNLTERTQLDKSLHLVDIDLTKLGF